MIINKKLFVLLAIVGPFVIYTSFVSETETIEDIDVKGNFKKEEDSSKIQNVTREKVDSLLNIENFTSEKEHI